MSLTPLRRPGTPGPLSETAAAWVLKVEEGLSSSEEQAFRDWIAVPEHSAAYEDALWALDAVHRHSGSPELLAMRSAALAQKSDKNRAPWVAGLTALAATFIGLFLWFSVIEPPQAGRQAPVELASASETPANGLYRTGVGERSAVVLPDGSIATLDTDSQLRVAYSDKERGVVLVRGQALFEVAKGKPAPFQVYAASQRITAVGTTFNVRIRGDRVQVSMVEGVVKVRPARQQTPTEPAQELTLRAGETLLTQPMQAASIQAVDVSQVATWRGGMLVFEDEKLGDAIAEVNRYTETPIRLSDPSVGEYRVSGVFRTNDPERFAQAMTEVFPLEVKPDARGSPTLSPKS